MLAHAPRQLGSWLTWDVGQKIMSESRWPFADPKNVAVFTVAEIICGHTPILRVCHDEEDGGWQFLSGRPLPEKKDWKLVSLESVAKLDPSVKELADLPCGWEAERESLSGIWKTKPQAV